MVACPQTAPSSAGGWGLPRLLLCLATALIVAGALAPSALGHAVLISSVPEENARLAAAPASLTLRFSEPVQIVEEVAVVDGSGASVAGGATGTDPRDARAVVVPLLAGLRKGTYTVAYTVLSADSHVIAGVFVFGVGNGPLAAPREGSGSGRGPGETSVWAVSARFLELVALGGLLGLIGFRWLIWRPVLRSRARPESAADQRTVLHRERDGFWTAFGVLAVMAVAAEGYLLLVKSAGALGTSVLGAAADPGGVRRVLASGRFGDLAELRAGFLFGLFALGAWQFGAEYGVRREPRDATFEGRLLPATLMGALSMGTLATVSYQGHASTAPFSTLSVVADTAHLTGASIWIAGLALTAVALHRLPRSVEDGGPRLAAAVLARFSRVALLAVAVIVATGVMRSFAELSDPAQLWETGFGRSIVLKLLLLCPIAALALRNRRLLTAVSRVERPGVAALRLVRWGATIELGLALGVVLVASVLVAQVPGRTVADADALGRSAQAASAPGGAASINAVPSPPLRRSARAR